MEKDYDFIFGEGNDDTQWKYEHGKIITKIFVL